MLKLKPRPKKYSPGPVRKLYRRPASGILEAADPSRPPYRICAKKEVWLRRD